MHKIISIFQTDFVDNVFVIKVAVDKYGEACPLLGNGPVNSRLSA
jgi:hypothetical protein